MSRRCVRRALAKRSMDLALSSILLIATVPIQAAVAAAIRAKMGYPVIFRQVRPGLHGEPFTLYKFRTMLTPEQAGGTVDDGARLTKLGMFLRATSLDELPSLWNVLRGDMSLVGPRPLLMDYLPLYSSEQARRHDVRPGLTGLAQVSGRNELSWDERFRLDLAYVDNHTIWGDIKILLRTIAKVALRKGISAPDHATMPKFEGAGNTNSGEPSFGSGPPELAHFVSA